MKTHAAVPSPSRAATKADPVATFALQRCACGGEREEECEECRNQAVQASAVAGSPAGPGGPPSAAAGHSLGALDIFPRIVSRSGEGRPAGGAALQRSASVAPPPGHEEEEEPEGIGSEQAAALDSAAEEGDDGEAVAGIEAGEPFGGGGGEAAQEAAPPEERDEAVQTFSSGGASPVRIDAKAVHRSLAGAGRPLPGAVRRPMERFFGRDLSAVRIHADDRAGRLARAVAAEAFTVGEHVAFASGAWQPAEAGGRGLLAHELRHVLQQRAGLSGEIVRQGIGRSGDAWETEAEEAARDFSRREAREGGPPEAAGDPAAGEPDAPADAALPTGGPAPALSPEAGGGPGGALQLYSGSNAAAYARRWAMSVNSAYGEFPNDCTNFVSQSLAAGGWQMVTGCDRCTDRRNNDVWWFRRDGCTRLIRSNVHASHTWGGAENLYQFLRASGRGEPQGHVMDLRVGDVLQFDTNGNNLARHSMVVTRKTDANLFLSYHTSSHLDEPFYRDGENEGILARNPSPPKNYFAWRITGDTGPVHTCPTCTPRYLGGGLYLQEDCTAILGPGPKI